LKDLVLGKSASGGVSMRAPERYKRCEGRSPEQATESWRLLCLYL
jgi:hypothetical protein